MKELSKEELSKYMDEEIEFAEGMIKHCKLNTPKGWIERHQAMLQIKQLISQSGRQVDEEWIKKKADIIWTCHWESLKEVKDFLCQIVSEIQKLQKEE